MQVVTNNPQPTQQQQPQQQSSNTNHRSNNSGSGNSGDSTSSTFNPLAVIEHLQQSLRQEQTRRVELEKECLELRRKCAELQNQMSEQDNVVQKVQELQRAQFDSVKKRLLRTLKSSVPENDSNAESDVDGQIARKRIEYIHECDECTFRTKSDVSLILHKMNHTTDQQYILSTSSFTTRNSNSKSIYQCSACDAKKLTRHQVYRHIYDVHTTEKPLCCPYCELSFTHRDYLAQHIPVRHDKLPVPKTPQNDATVFESPTTSIQTSSSSSTNRNENQSSGSKPHRGRIMSAQSSSASNHNNNNTAELKCTFPDCNFVTNFSDKLDFHMKAHITTKFKCPYCPYVSNTMVDIKRHIQKSKKHEGLKMYSCQKCSFAADCDRAFKEHLRGYHFGYEAPDQIIEYFIEEMFSNKNAKRGEDEDGPPEMISMILDCQNGTNSNSTPISPPISSSRNATSMSSVPPPAKKQATSVAKNGPIRINSIPVAIVGQKGQPRYQTPTYRSTTPSNAGNQPPTQPQQEALIQIPITTNPNSFMYSNLELTATEHAVNFVTEGQNNIVTIRGVTPLQQNLHHHQQQLAQQPRQNSSTSQTTQSQTPTQSSSGVTTISDTTELPNSAVTLTQYVSYANPYN